MQLKYHDVKLYFKILKYCYIKFVHLISHDKGIKKRKETNTHTDIFVTNKEEITHNNYSPWFLFTCHT